MEFRLRRPLKEILDMETEYYCFRALCDLMKLFIQAFVFSIGSNKLCRVDGKGIVKLRQQP
jgi:hypothetical protein